MSDDLWFVQHDFVCRTDKKGNPVAGLPEIGRSKSGAKYPVSTKLRNFIVALNTPLHPELSKAALTKALSKVFRNNGGWCNGSGWDSGQFKIVGAPSGGATLRATSNPPTYVMGGGKLWLEVYAIDPKKVPANPTSIEEVRAYLHAGLVFFCTTALNNASNLFPNLGGRFVIPLLGPGGVQYVRAGAARFGPSETGLVKVDRVQMPCIPARPDAVAGLIP